MPVFTIQTLADRAAALADMHDGFVKPAEWLSWYNKERRALQLFLARHGAAQQNLQFITSTGADLVDLTEEILAVVGVWEIQNGRPNRQLRIVNFPDNFVQFDSSIQFGQVTGRSNTVTISESNDNSISLTTFRFYPSDLFGSYLIVIAQAPSQATSMTDTTSLPMGLEELLVLNMARKALMKEESDVKEIKELIKEEEARVEQYAWSRSLAQAPSMRNVDSVQRGWGSNGLDFPHPDLWTWL